MEYLYITLYVLFLSMQLKVTYIYGHVYFEETFPDNHYTDHWIESTSKGVEQGKFELATGLYYGDYWLGLGLKTSQDSKYYGISTKLPKPISNRDKTLVIQYQVKFENYVECGGGYLKILGSDFDPLQFSTHTPYKIMFGPDICGDDKNIVQVILNYKDKNYPITKRITCNIDRFSHLYTLILRPNNTYSVKIDNKVVESGTLEEDFKLLKPKIIRDPNATKPSNWVDQEKIIDPSDKKPLGWDQPITIPDPNAKKPETWDDEVDGIWHPPKIANPLYKGEWKPQQIPNPKYKGPWIPPEIDNPDYEPDPEMYVYDDIGGLGFDIWQVRSGSIFDNIYITDDENEAYEFGETLWREAFDGEVSSYNFKQEALKQEKEYYKKLYKEHEKAQELEKEEAEDQIMDENENEEKIVKDEL